MPVFPLDCQSPLIPILNILTEQSTLSTPPLTQFHKFPPGFLRASHGLPNRANKSLVYVVDGSVGIVLKTENMHHFHFRQAP